jgi:hypothetical protein
MRFLLRTLAVAIVAVAAFDPVVTRTMPLRPRVAVVAADPVSTATAAVRGRLSRELATLGDVVARFDSSAAAVVVVGDRYPDRSFAAALSAFAGPVATITVPSPEVALARVTGPREVPAATTIRFEVDVDGRHAAGQSTDLVARISGIEVARASHTWTRPSERWHTTLDVAPFGDPPFVVRLSAAESAADFVVGRRARPLRVMAYDARPSWSSTFTRRAIERDPRFHVASVVVTSRGAATRTVDAVDLADPRLDEFDVVMIGGVDALPAVDWRALDRYVQERGGSVVLLPDERTVGPSAFDRIANGAAGTSLTERLLDRPAVLQTTGGAPLQTSEILLPPHTGAEVLASLPVGDPVIVAVPRGAGRLVVSGAMDAWRFRGASDRGFDRFWQSTLAGLALAAPPIVDVSVWPRALQPGEPAEIVVRARRVASSTRVQAEIDGRAVRLWPDAERGVYRGSFTASLSSRRSLARAVVSDVVESVAETIVPIGAEVQHVSDRDVAPLALLASGHAGIDADADHLHDIVRFVRDRLTPRSERRAMRPMRSAWWILPLTACLAGEWWLRRRRGLR